MEVVDLSINGLKLVKPRIFYDDRGYFTESYHESRYMGIIPVKFVQDNHSFSSKNVIRGMHFQRKFAQDKLVFVISGKIFDVAVDIRPGSPTFGKWEGVFLDSEQSHQLFIPQGFAHGFAVLSENAHVVYKISSYFDSEDSGYLRYDDPEVNISWPVQYPILSEKDRRAPFLRDLLL